MKNKTSLLNLTNENFRHQVLENPHLVLVKFGASWSGPCHILTPIIEELVATFSDKVDFCRMDVDKFPEITKKFNIQCIPTLLFFNTGKVVEQTTGVISKSELEKKLLALLQQ